MRGTKVGDGAYKIIFLIPNIRSFVKLSRLVKSVTKVVKGCLRVIKFTIFVV